MTCPVDWALLFGVGRDGREAVKELGEKVRRHSLAQGRTGSHADVDARRD